MAVKEGTFVRINLQLLLLISNSCLVKTTCAKSSITLKNGIEEKEIGLFPSFIDVLGATINGKKLQ